MTAVLQKVLVHACAISRHMTNYKDFVATHFPIQRETQIRPAISSSLTNFPWYVEPYSCSTYFNTGTCGIPKAMAIQALSRFREYNAVPSEFAVSMQYPGTAVLPRKYSIHIQSTGN